MTADVLTVRDVTKKFPPNLMALEGASLDVRRGEVHCLLGANGAGKSTLLKIIAGAYRPTEGQFLVDGQPVRLRSPHEAAMAGISMIYQELDLIPQMTVEQNLYLGHAPNRWGILTHEARRRGAIEALRRVGATFSPDTRVERLSIANQQLTAIARALTRDAKLIIMDEPSAALNERELVGVFEVVRDLVRQGVSILYVSHRLNEIREIGDRVTVLRGGRTIATFDVAGTSEATLVEAVIGDNRTLIERVARQPVGEEVVLDVRSLDGPEGVRIRNLKVRRGEIVGLAGLTGAGRTTFLKSLFGALPSKGEILLEGTPFQPSGPGAAIRRGLGFVPENRKIEGLVLDAAIYRNAALPSLRRQKLVDHRRLRERVTPALKELSTKYDSPDRAVRNLSGGNQQKVVLAKWIVDGSRVLLLDEPSRGLDVGAKAELYGLVRGLADSGAAIIVASSELEELYAACDAIWVFHEGRNARCFDPAVDDRNSILEATILGARS